MPGGRDREHWSRVADEWVAWARAPNHDAFWAYRRLLAGFIGRGNGKALDVGCGEGRVSRELVSLGYRVTAVDPIAALVEAAAAAGSAHSYAVAEAGQLPFQDSSFDLVLAYNVLMSVDDLSAAVREARRVMQPTARLVVSIVHPFADRGQFAGPDSAAPFVVNGSYLDRQRFSGVEERGGLTTHYAGWSQSLEVYVGALADAGLAVTALREPVPDAADGRADLNRWKRIPMFLWLEARSG